MILIIVSWVWLVIDNLESRDDLQLMADMTQDDNSNLKVRKIRRSQLRFA